MDRKVIISVNHPYFWPIIAASSILGLALIAFSVHVVGHMFDQPVAVALAAARQSSDYQLAIGEPSRAKFMTTGNLNEKNGAGNGDLIIRVTGPNGSGKLLEWTQEVQGKWHVCSLTLELQNPSRSTEIVPGSATDCKRD